MVFRNIAGDDPMAWKYHLSRASVSMEFVASKSPSNRSAAHSQ